MRGDPAPARAGRRNSGACRKDSGIDTRARFPADKSCAQCFKHRAQRRWIYASPDPQPLAGRQHQFQNNICGSLRPNGSCFHQCESHRLPLSQPLPPIVEGLFRNLLLPTKLLHGHPAALLRSNPFAPTFFSVSDFLFHAGSLRHGPLCVIQTALKTAVHKALTDMARSMEGELNLLRRDALEGGLDKAPVWAEFVDWTRLLQLAEVWRPLESKIRQGLSNIRRSEPDAVESHRKALIADLAELETVMRPLNAGAIAEMAEKLKGPPPASQN